MMPLSFVTSFLWLLIFTQPTAAQPSCADREDFSVIATIQGPVSKVSLGLDECRFANETLSIPQAFTMTRFVWTVEPTDDAVTTISTTNGYELVSATTTTIVVEDDQDDVLELAKNGTLQLSFLPGRDITKVESVGLVLRIPRDQLVDLEYNFRDSAVILQLNDGFTTLRTLSVYASSTQSRRHVTPGEGPTLIGVSTNSAYPLDVSLRGNAMDVSLESGSGFESVYIESLNSDIRLKGNLFENDRNYNQTI